MKIDTAEIKKKIDLRGMIESYTQLHGGPVEFYGSCPRCGGRDRFHFRADRGWFCRKCTGDPSQSRWHDAIDLVMLVHNVNFVQAYEMLSSGGEYKLTDEEVAEREKRQKQFAADAEHRRMELNESQVWKTYHENLDKLGARYLWHERGLSDQWIDYYKLGFCERREYPYGKERVYIGASLTIPTWRMSFDTDWTPRYTCVSLVHRIMGDPPCGKYRPHTSGLGKQLFYADISSPVIDGSVLLVEGEIKAMVTYAAIQDEAHRYADKGLGMPLMGRLTVVGHPGSGIKKELIEEFSNASTIWICLDPDATREAETAAAALGVERCRIVELPGKIDDMLNEKSMSVEDLYHLLVNARFP